MKKKKLSDNYGSARWMEYKELKKYGFLQCGGVVLGLTESAKYKFKTDKQSGNPIWRLKRPGKIIFDNSSYHILVACPTGRGKGINFVIPTLISWSESIIVYDIKKENYNITGGWRRLFSHVLRIELASDYSVKFNPLAEIIPGHEVEIAQIISETFSDPGGDAKNDYWDIQAKDFIMIIILHVYFANEEKSLRSVYNFFVDPDRSISQKLTEMLKTPHLDGKPHPTIQAIAKSLLDTAENSEREMSGIINSVRTKFSTLSDPIITNNLSSSDFKISDLVDRKLPVSLYYVVSPTDEKRLRPLTRLFLNLAGKMLTKSEIPKGGKLNRHQIAFMLDEFPSLGKLPFIQDQIAYFRGWKIKLMLIAQSFNQIYDKYGERTSIPANCDIKIVMGANDASDAKIINDLLGTKTVQSQTSSESKNADSFGIKGESHSKGESARALLTMSEISQLPFDRVIILYSGKSPYLAKKLMYYLDKRFTDKVNLPTADKEVEQIAELPPIKEQVKDFVITVSETPETSSETTAGEDSMTVDELENKNIFVDENNIFFSDDDGDLL